MSVDSPDQNNQFLVRDMLVGTDADCVVRGEIPEISKINVKYSYFYTISVQFLNIQTCTVQ